MEGSQNHVKFNSAAYFSTPVWTAECPMFIKPMLKLTDRYLKKARKKNLQPLIKERDKRLGATLEDFTLSNHSESFNADPKAKEFVDFCGHRSYEFLDWCGFDLKNHSLHFTELAGFKNFHIKEEDIMIRIRTGINMYQDFSF